MKTYSAYQFIRNPAPVYDAACKDGAVKINHGQYKDTIFVLSAKERGSVINPSLSHNNDNPDEGKADE